jgi:hypothetical protein
VDTETGRGAVTRLHPPTVNVKKRGLAPSNRRGLIAFSGSPMVPWVVFAVGSRASQSFPFLFNSARSLETP